MHHDSPRTARRTLAALVLAPTLALSTLPAMAQTQPSAGAASTPTLATSMPADVHLDGWSSQGDVDLYWSTSTPEAVHGWDLTHSSGAPSVRLATDVLNHTFTDVAAGEHTYLLRPVLSDGSLGEPASHTVTVEQSVPRPTGFTATLDGGTAVLTWDASPQATGWILARGWNDEYLPASTTTHRVEGLEPGEHTFHLAMRAGSAHGRSVDTTVVVPDIAEPTEAPSAPRDLTATLDGDNTVQLSWNAPENDGGGHLAGYRVTTPTGVVELDPDHTSHTVDGLALGARAEFTVQAVNKIGAGTAARAHVDVPALAPFAPTDLDARVDGTDVTLTWTPSPRETGAPVSGWKVTSPRGSWTLPADARSHRFTSLTRGVAHTLTVTAINDAGEGAAGTITTPAASPASAPRDLTFYQSGEYRGANWKAPENDGGADIIGYDVTVNGTTQRHSAWSTGVNLNAYLNPIHLRISVVAVTSAGTGESAAISAKVLRSAPAAPRITGIWWFGGDGPTISWAQGDPTFDPALTGYTVVLPDGKRIDLGPGVTSYVITGQIGANQTVQVIARSATGNSPAATRKHDFGHRNPGAPRDVKVTWNRNDATVTWQNPAAAHGHAWLNWTIKAGDRTATTSSSLRAVFKDLPRGNTKFTISAKGNKGGGNGTAASVTSKPSVYTPDAPRAVDTSHKGTTLTVTWKAPKDDGGKKIKHYLIYLNGKQKAKPKANATKHSFKDVKRGTLWKVEVRAVSDKGKGLVAKTEHIIPGKPPKPRDPSTSSFFGGDVTFNWRDPAHFGGTEHVGYEVQWQRRYNEKWHGGYTYTTYDSFHWSTGDFMPYGQKNGKYRMRVKTVTKYGKSDWTKWTKWVTRKR